MKASHRADRTGRSQRGPPFVRLPLYMLESAAWRSLSLAARAAFIELAFVYKGFNNGQLGMSARFLAERLGCSKATAARALNELNEKGFIGVQKTGVYGRPLATEYYLTLYRNDVDGEPPSKAFMRWTSPKPVQKSVSKTHKPVSPEGLSQQNCSEQSHQRDCNGGFEPIPSLTGETHIDIPEGVQPPEDDSGGPGFLPLI